jgi:hypothetical protein
MRSQMEDVPFPLEERTEAFPHGAVVFNDENGLLVHGTPRDWTIGMLEYWNNGYKGKIRPGTLLLTSHHSVIPTFPF